MALLRRLFMPFDAHEVADWESGGKVRSSIFSSAAS